MRGRTSAIGTGAAHARHAGPDPLSCLNTIHRTHHAQRNAATLAANERLGLPEAALDGVQDDVRAPVHARQ